jgi:hypothetical protein
MMKMQQPNFSFRLFSDKLSQYPGKNSRTSLLDAGKCTEKKMEELILSKLNIWQIDAEVQSAMHAYE